MSIYDANNVRWATKDKVGKVINWTDDAGEHSRSIEDREVSQWLADGNRPADPPPDQICAPIAVSAEELQRTLDELHAKIKKLESKA